MQTRVADAQAYWQACLRVSNVFVAHLRCGMHSLADGTDLIRILAAQR